MLQNLSTDRRKVLGLSASAFGFGLIPALAHAQSETDEGAGAPTTSNPQPTVEARFPAEIASGIFILPDRRIPLVPNVGIIVGSDRVLVVDCGLGIDSAEAVLDVVRRLAPGREIVLTLTHAHPEHGFGAQVFLPDATIFYNRSQADHLAAAGEQLLNGFRGGVLAPEHRFLLDGIQLAQPTDTYDEPETRIDLGGREVILRSVGTAHSPGDQIIYVPDANVFFVGDLIEERIYPIVPYFPPLIGAVDINLDTWRSELKHIAELSPSVIVPGHGNLGGIEITEDVDLYLATLLTVAASGSNTDVMVQEMQRRFPTWEQPEYIAPALQYLSR